MQKWWFMAMAILLAICVSGCAGKKYLYRDITEGRQEEVDSVKCLSYEASEEECEKIENWLLAGEYHLYKGSLGSTRQRRFAFLDAEGNTLYTVTDVGNQNLIQVEIEGRSKTYQRDEKDE